MFECAAQYKTETHSNNYLPKKKNRKKTINNTKRWYSNTYIAIQFSQIWIWEPDKHRFSSHTETKPKQKLRKKNKRTKRKKECMDNKIVAKNPFSCVYLRFFVNEIIFINSGQWLGPMCVKVGALTSHRSGDKRPQHRQSGRSVDDNGFSRALSLRSLQWACVYCWSWIDREDCFFFSSPANARMRCIRPCYPYNTACNNALSLCWVSSRVLVSFCD